MWIDANKGKSHCMFALSLSEPLKRIIAIAQ
jgi:hypothetical protein